MSYDLVLTEQGVEDTKAVGDNIFFANLPAKYPVYAFYYPSETPDATFEQSLRSLGERTGSNLFLNIGRLDDPQYNKISKTFEIDSLPVLILTAVAELAAPEDEPINSYVRMSKKHLASPDAISQIEKLYLLFLQGDVAGAISSQKWKTRTDLLKALGKFFGSQIKGLLEYAASRDFTVSLLTGRIEVKKSAS